MKNAAEARKMSERRRPIDPTTSERDYFDDETAFMTAMDCYKRDNRRPFPTWNEVLVVLRDMGYRKVAEPSAVPGTTIENELQVPQNPDYRELLGQLRAIGHRKVALPVAPS